MNFLQLFASGASFLNFNFQNKAAQTVETIPKKLQKPQGFHKVEQASHEVSNFNESSNHLDENQTVLLSHILQQERQQLINRYLQLNLQLLQEKIQNPLPSNSKLELPQNSTDSVLSKDSKEQLERIHSSKKKIKKIVMCGHNDKQHYAKGLCNNCYHKYGRNKKPWNCPHDKLYAAGMCQNCYINQYNKKKREQNLIVEEKSEKICQKVEQTLILCHQSVQEVKKEQEKN